MRTLTLALLAVSAVGCSLVFDTANRMGSDGAIDAGDPGDAGDAGDAAPDAPPIPPLPTPEEFCAFIAAESCAAVGGCCSTVDPTADPSACVAQNEAECNALVTVALDRDYLVWDAAGAEAALEEGARLARDCDIAILDYYLRRDGFYGGIGGTRTLGAPCAPESANATEAVIAIISCEDGAVCVDIDDTDMENWICQELGGSGDHCQTSLQCDGSRPRCQPAARLGVQECGTGALADALCVRDDQCFSNSCELEVVVSRCGNLPTQDEIFCPAASDAEG